jgi:hypothetical protein
MEGSNKALINICRSMEIKGSRPSHLFFMGNIMIRVLSMNNIMRLLKKLEELHGDKLIIEFQSDHSGCVKSAATYDIKAAWSDLDQFNELMKEHCYVRPNRSAR